MIVKTYEIPDMNTNYTRSLHVNINEKLNGIDKNDKTHLI